MNDQELTKILDKAKVQLMMNRSVFLNTILFSLKQSWEPRIKTAKVNGTYLYINPDWFISLTEPQRIGLLFHEAFHVALNHMVRLGNKNPIKWNKAGDHVINLMALANGYELPPNGLWDRQYIGMSTLEVYNLLPDEKDKNFDGDLIFLEADDPNAQEKEVAITNIVIKAITQSKMEGDEPGTIPEEISRKIQELINPVLPWQDILTRFLNDKTKDDYTWAKPNKRFMPEFHLPSQYSESLDSIAIAIDTSGSVTDKQFKEFLNEINYIHEVMKPKKLTVIDFDTSIKTEHIIHEGDSIKNIKFSGYGGTNIKPIIEWGNKNKPTALLVFTDGYFAPYEPDINFELMWIINSHPTFKSNIGETIFYDQI